MSNNGPPHFEFGQDFAYMTTKNFTFNQEKLFEMKKESFNFTEDILLEPELTTKMLSERGLYERPGL